MRLSSLAGETRHCPVCGNRLCATSDVLGQSVPQVLVVFLHTHAVWFSAEYPRGPSAELPSPPSVWHSLSTPVLCLGHSSCLGPPDSQLCLLNSGSSLSSACPRPRPRPGTVPGLSQGRRSAPQRSLCFSPSRGGHWPSSPGAQRLESLPPVCGPFLRCFTSHSVCSLVLNIEWVFSSSKLQGTPGDTGH